MNKFAVMLLLLFIPGSRLVAQQHLHDSLRQGVIKHTAKDTVRANAIAQYLKSGVNNHLPDFLIFLNELIQLSKHIRYGAGLSKGYQLAVIYYESISEHIKSIAYADSAFEMLRNDSGTNGLHAKGCLYNNRGLSLSALGEYKKALDDYLAALEIFEPLKDPMIVCAYDNISELYGAMNMETKCLEYKKIAIKKAEQLNDDNIMCLTLLGYSTDLLMMSGKPEKATEILNKAGPLVAKLQNRYYEQLLLLNTGMVFEINKNYGQAIEKYKDALLLSRQNNNPYQECIISGKMADCFGKMNDKTSAKQMLDVMLNTSSRFGLRYLKNEAYKKLSAWYRTRGQYRLSDACMQQFVALNDTLASEKIISEVTRLEGKYKLEQKDAEIDQLKKISLLQELSLKQKKWLNYILAASAVVLLLTVLLVFANYRQKQQLQQQQISELILGKKLSTTEAILNGEEKERSRIAKDLHDGLSGMLSGVKFSLQNIQGNLIMTPVNQQAFERSMDMLDNSINEMRRVAQNMMPAALVQFGLDVALKDFVLEINKTGIIHAIYESMGLAEKKIDQTTAMTIFRIVQELVNNAIKHSHAQQVFIQLLVMDDKKFIVNVDDTGSGFDKALLQSNPGMGWKNIVTRTEYLKGTIDIQTAPGKGTAVNIEINLPV